MDILGEIYTPVHLCTVGNHRYHKKQCSKTSIDSYKFGWAYHTLPVYSGYIHASYPDSIYEEVCVAGGAGGSSVDGDDDDDGRWAECRILLKPGSQWVHECADYDLWYPDEAPR